MRHVFTRRRQRGFSLIEIIVSLMIVGIMSAVVYSYMGSTLTNSVFPVLWLNDAQKVNEVMEQIKRDYDEEFPSHTGSAAPWIETFFDNEIYPTYRSDVDSLTYVLGSFDGNLVWTNDSSSKYLKVTLTKNLQKVIGVFSE